MDKCTAGQRDIDCLASTGLQATYSFPKVGSSIAAVWKGRHGLLTDRLRKDAGLRRPIVSEQQSNSVFLLPTPMHFVHRQQLRDAKRAEALLLYFQMCRGCVEWAVSPRIT